MKLNWASFYKPIWWCEYDLVSYFVSTLHSVGPNSGLCFTVVVGVIVCFSSITPKFTLAGLRSVLTQRQHFWMLQILCCFLAFWQYISCHYGDFPAQNWMAVHFSALFVLQHGQRCYDIMLETSSFLEWTIYCDALAPHHKSAAGMVLTMDNWHFSDFSDVKFQQFTPFNIEKY